MYGYKNYIKLNTEEILSRVSEEDIYKIVFPEGIFTDKIQMYKAPYREDSEPGCYFEYYESKLCFVDFADSLRTKNCFQFIMKTINKDFTESLEFINSSLKLGLGNSNCSLMDVVKKSKNDLIGCFFDGSNSAITQPLLPFISQNEEATMKNTTPV